MKIEMLNGPEPVSSCRVPGRSWGHLLVLCRNAGLLLAGGLIEFFFDHE
jgi:hypothetical protein